MMRTSLFIILMLLAVFGSQPPSAAACLCVADGQSPADEFAVSAAVFTGRAINRFVPYLGLPIGDNSAETVTFQVLESWKGPIEKSLGIVTARHGLACGYAFDIGQEYLVYTREHDGNLTTSTCSRTKPLANAGDDLAFLGSGVILPPDSMSPWASLTEFALPTAFAAAGIMVVAIVIGAASRLRR